MCRPDNFCSGGRYLTGLFAQPQGNRSPGSRAANSSILARDAASGVSGKSTLVIAIVCYPKPMRSTYRVFDVHSGGRRLTRLE